MQRVRSVFTGVAGGPYYTNMFFPDANGSVGAQALVDAVRDVWTAYQLNLRAGMVVTVQGEVPTIDPASGQPTGSFAVTPRSVTFNNASQQFLPPATQLLVRLSTPTYAAGRRIQGHLFIPGWTEDANVGAGVPADNLITEIPNKWAPIAVGTARIGVWSRARGTFNQISSISANPNWRTLRSRLPS